MMVAGGCLGGCVVVMTRGGETMTFEDWWDQNNIQMDCMALESKESIKSAYLSAAKISADIAMTYHHGGTCQISNRCRPCVISQAIKDKFGLEI